VVQPRTFTLDTAISNWPIALSGFNAAIIAPSAATAANPKATSFDIPNKYSFYQSGLSGATRGLPVSGVFASLSDSHTAFQLGPYGATNALMLGYNYAKSATLTLSAPQRCNSLAILATSANGGGSGTLVLNFSDGTKSPAFNFNAQDWFGTVTNVALQGFGRLKLGSPLTVEDNGASNPNLYQTSLNLAALGLTSPISSITFFNPANAGTQQNTAVLAVSGMPTPEVTVTASWNTTNLVLNWSGNGKLLEATNIMGPWTTNVVTAPVTVTPSQEQNFYRVAP
jgi:hypothetical protein